MRTGVAGRRTAVAIGVLSLMGGCTGQHGSNLRFSISFPQGVRSDPLTGRVFLILSRSETPEPRMGAGSFTQSNPFFAVDVSVLAPGQATEITDTTLGYPVASLRGIPAGDYYVQAVANVYTEFHRSDGHTMWAHMDQWEGQHFATSPGNLVSAVQPVHLDPAAGYDIPISLTQVLPAIEEPADTKWVKHVKIQSKLLTAFWGHPMYLGATVLLPQGYDEHPNVHYPVVYEQGHFGFDAPLDFATDSTTMTFLMHFRRGLHERYNLETAYQFYQEWTSPHFPRFIAMTFQHPTPYFDDSYAVNSANNGPYGNAIMTELIPYVESHFRIIAKPYARVLTGGSTGGWESLALQVYHPDFFGGTWTLYPDPVDFRHYGLLDAYTDTSAFVDSDPGILPSSPISEWLHPERTFFHGLDGQAFLTVRQESQLEEVLGSHGRSTEQLEAWESVYSPVGSDGYPVPLWDKRTGHVNKDVIAYMRDHGYDLRAYLQKNWAAIGPKLVGKIHVDCGDMDGFFLNLAVGDLQAFFDSSTAPHVAAEFHYGRPERGHGWQHAWTGKILEEMAITITAHAPHGENTAAWKY